MAAIANIVRTIFSPSPTHLEVRVLAEIDINVDFDCAAMAFPRRVLPVPGGPKKSTPYTTLNYLKPYPWRSSDALEYIRSEHWPDDDLLDVFLRHL